MKFKIGDLVTLSSAGRKNNHNEAVLSRIGIVTNTSHRREFPYQVRWLGTTLLGFAEPTNELPMKEYELKFAKKGALDNL